MTNQNIQDVVTGRVRLNYPHVFTPHAWQPGEEPKYSATVLVPKTDIATKQRIDTAINAAIQEGVSSRWNGVRPPLLAIPVYDGDGVRPSDGTPFGEECKGHWVFTASSKLAPHVVDLSMQRIVNQTEVYSGIYARVSVSFYPYAFEEKKGIGCGLGPVQKLEDGEPLGARISAAAAFGDNGGGYNSAWGQNSIYTQKTTAYPQNSEAYPQKPVHNFQIPVYTLQQPVYQQPNFAASAQAVYPQQPIQYDPITGAPISGGVMGL